MRTGAGRAPLIIAGVAALVAYATFGEQTPFGFLHHFGGHPHKITISTDKSADTADDARQAAEDRAQQEADRVQERADRAQEMRDRAREMSERAKEMAQTAVETAKEAVSAIPPIPAVPAIPAIPGAPANTEVRTLDPFDSVTIENNATATITIGDSQSVSISGGPGQTQTRVHDGKLTVSGSTPGVHVAITLPHLRALQVNGYGQVDLQGLRDPITIKANGAVQLSASGTVESAELTMNGPSKFALSKLEARNLVIQVNGVGDADVYATENLVADIRGVGHVSYRGSPHLVTKINGPGSVQHVASSEG